MGEGVVGEGVMGEGVMGEGVVGEGGGTVGKCNHTMKMYVNVDLVTNFFKRRFQVHSKSYSN